MMGREEDDFVLAFLARIAVILRSAVDRAVVSKTPFEWRLEPAGRVNCQEKVQQAVDTVANDAADRHRSLLTD